MLKSLFTDLTSPEGSKLCFTKFSELPPEIRLKIWKMSLPGSRILRMRCLSGVGLKVSRGKSIFRRRLLFPSNSLDGLVMLHVCREARAVVRRHFDLLPNRNESVQPKKGLNLEYPLYYDCSADTLYFDALKDLGFFTFRNFNGNAKIGSIRRIAVAVSVGDEAGTQSRRVIEEKATKLYQLATVFPRLEQCVVVDLQKTAPSPLLDFMQILETLIDKERSMEQISNAMHARSYDPGVGAQPRSSTFTRMTEPQFWRVGEAVRSFG